MADYDSSLPVRSEADGTDERVHSKIVDYSDPGGAGKQLEVTADGEALVQVQGDNPAGGVEILRLSELGAVNPDGDYHATNNTKPASIGLLAHDRAVSPADTDQNLRLTGVDSTADTDVHALDVAIRDEEGNPYTTSNPLPVTSVDSEGDEINDYETDAAIAAGADASHDYTVTALKTFKGTQIEASGSGKIKMEVQVESGVATGIYATKWVKFNSTASPNIELCIKELLEVAAGVIIRVLITNRDKQPQDVYSTISGHEI